MIDFWWNFQARKLLLIQHFRLYVDDAFFHSGQIKSKKIPTQKADQHFSKPFFGHGKLIKEKQKDAEYHYVLHYNLYNKTSVISKFCT